MDKVYQYRSPIRWGQYVFLAFPLMTIVTLGFLAVSSFQLWRAIHPSSSFPIGLALVMCSVSLILLVGSFLIWYLYYRMAGVRVIVDDNYLLYKYRGGEKKISFEHITKIKLSSIPYLGGWITIVAGKEKIQLTVMINEISDFVQTLKTSLDKVGSANQYDESKLFLFFKTATFSDQSWERIYAIFWKFILITLGTGLVGLSIANISGSVGFFWILFSVIYPSLVYIGTEIIYGVRIAKGSIRETFFAPPRDIAYEKSVYKVALITGSIVYLLVVLMVFLPK